MSRPILIAGGGIGGLTLAALLRRRGRECVVLERASRLEAVGAGIILQPNAVKALRIGGLEDAVALRGAAMRQMEIRDHRGRVLSAIDSAAFGAQFGAGLFGFHRATLQAALLALVDPRSVRLNAGVQAFDAGPDGVTVELESGECLEGESLVGADGLRSAVRRQRLDDGEPRYSGYTSWRGVCPRGSLWPEGHMSESWGRGARFGLVAIDGDRVYWFATANVAAGGRETSKRDLLARLGDWHEPIGAVVEATPDASILRTDIADREPVEDWGEGRVTLLGDAAHPMTPNLGQGGCQAIEDAVVLDLCLTAHPIVMAALRDYEDRRRARTARVVTEARRFGDIGQIENGALRGLRNAAVRWTPLPATLRSLRWLYDFDV